MIVRALVASFYFFFAIVAVIVAQEVQPPATVQIDVVFPRQGETYAPIYPFPVVLAIHNISAAWKHSFQFTWDIREVDRPDKDHDRPVGEWPVTLDEYLPTGPTTDVPSPPDTWLFINATDGFAYAKEGKFELGISAEFHVNCTDPPVSDEALRFSPTAQYVAFEFFIAEDGKLPSISEGNECAQAQVAVGIDKTITFDAEQRRPELTDFFNKPCPVLADPPPPLKECAYRATTEDQAKVVAEMLAVTGCDAEGKSWPDKSIREPCESSAQGRKHQNAASFITMLGCITTAAIILPSIL